MRLFIAFSFSQIPDTVKAAQQTLGQLPAKQILSQQLHLTFKFLGNVREEIVAECKKRLHSVAWKPIRAHLKGIGVFPSESYVRVVWLGAEPTAEICALQKQIDAALTGLFPPEKEFTVHMTLARIKNITDGKTFHSKLKEISIEPVEFVLDSFELMQSDLTPDGPKHTVIEKYCAKAS